MCALSAAAGTPPFGCCETWAASMRPGVVAVCCQPCCFQSNGRGKLPSLLLFKVNIKVNIVNACCVDDCQMLPCASHAAATRLRFGRVGTSLLLHQQVHTQSHSLCLHHPTLSEASTAPFRNYRLHHVRLALAASRSLPNGNCVPGTD